MRRRPGMHRHQGSRITSETVGSTHQVRRRQESAPELSDSALLRSAKRDADRAAQRAAKSALTAAADAENRRRQP